MAIPRDSESTRGSRRASGSRQRTNSSTGRSSGSQGASSSSRRSSLQAPPAETENASQDRRTNMRARRASSARRKSEQPVVDENGEFTKDGKTYRVDKVTGKTYRVIPKSEDSGVKDANGYAMPKLHVPDIGGFDADEMDRSAEEFLAHLRVAPNREEQARLRAEMQRREIERNKKYLQENAKAIEDSEKEEEAARRLYDADE